MKQNGYSGITPTPGYQPVEILRAVRDLRRAGIT